MERPVNMQKFMDDVIDNFMLVMPFVSLPNKR